MNKEIRKLKNCLEKMKKCLKIPNVENCVCFDDAFKALGLEAEVLSKKITHGLKNRQKLMSIKEEIENIKKNISRGDKKCLGCSPCMASLVFKNYPERLNSIYMENKL